MKVDPFISVSIIALIRETQSDFKTRFPDNLVYIPQIMILAPDL